ncbi:MAG TPA: GGDEF domain-containing protein [Limnochordia bacterium]|nr:GGDEF domain-containing protein [Limnochordia bacterium]
MPEQRIELIEQGVAGTGVEDRVDADLVSIDVWKTRVYSVALAIGAVVLFSFYFFGAIGGDRPNYQAVMVPAFAALCLVAVGLLRSGKVSLVFLERLGLVSLAIFYAWQVIHTLIFAPNLAAFIASLSSTVLRTLDSLCIVTLLVASARRGMTLCAGIVVATMAAVVWTVDFRFAPIPSEQSLLLWRIHLITAANVALICALALSKEQFSLARELARALARMAETDDLTGVANRRLLHRVLPETIEQARLSATPLAVILLDLDHFKRINDAEGHLAGDRVLAGVAATIRPQLARADVFGRWGGEEFLVICPGRDLDAALLCCERLRRVVQEVQSSAGPVTASLGCAVYRPGDTPETLIGRADAALYRAKSQGRDRVEAAGRETGPMVGCDRVV